MTLKKVPLNQIIRGDCLEVMKNIPDNSIDLIYGDPPFFTQTVVWKDEKDNPLIKDRFVNIYEYRNWMKDRIIEMKRILKPTGSLFIHVDQRSVAHLKIVMDEIFGLDNKGTCPYFRNWIIWYYRGAGISKKYFAKRHDDILWYSKSKTKWTFNPDSVRVPYAKATIERFKHYIGNIREGKDFGLQKLHPKGKFPDDVWEISIVAPSAKERFGYPTQKPEILLERIVSACSHKGDVVLDPFCGCGTTLVAAKNLGRKYIGIDVSAHAVRLVKKRLGIEVPPTMIEIHQLKDDEFEDWVVKQYDAKPTPRVGDYGFDGSFRDLNNRIVLVEAKHRQVGRPDVQKFESAMKSQHAFRGIMVGLSFSKDAEGEKERARDMDNLIIEFVKPETLVQVAEKKKVKELRELSLDTQQSLTQFK